MTTFAMSSIRYRRMNAYPNKTYDLEPPKYARPIVESNQYSEVYPYIETVEAIARLTYKSLYIIDYNNLDFLYISRNPLFLCGKSVEEVLREGYQFYHDSIYEEDLEFLARVNHASFNFLSKLPTSERTLYSLSYNFRIVDFESKEIILVNHQMTPLKLDSTGNVWLALCLVSLASSQEVGKAYISGQKDNDRWILRSNSTEWILQDDLQLLNEQEKKVIRLANQGLSIQDIARTIHRSEDSIKSYRRSIFRKLEVSNITEAVALATHRRMI